MTSSVSSLPQAQTELALALVEMQLQVSGESFHGHMTGQSTLLLTHHITHIPPDREGIIA